MVSRFFRRPSRSLKHHSVSLLPEVEAIIQTCVSHAMDRVTRRTGDQTNFSIAANMLILGRFAFALTDQRKGRNPDPDAIESLMDLVDGKRSIGDQDLEEFGQFLAPLSEAYYKRHSGTQ